MDFFGDGFGWFGGIFFRLLIRIFSPRPTIKREGDLVVIRSTWRTALLTLGAVGRKVVIDPKSKVIRTNARIFWVFHRMRRIEFDWIAEVFSTYTDLGDSYFSHFEEDLFCVGLKLKDGSHITLFRFYGQGEFINQSIWPDWMFAGDIMEGKLLPHSFEAESVGLADLLEAYLKVPVSNEF
jgi:hypothetical protein